MPPRPAAPVALLLALLGTTAAGRPPGGTISVSASPSELRIDARYQGETIRVAGNADADCDVIVLLASDPDSVTLLQKGKVGPFWLTVGRVELRGAPSLYKLFSTRPLVDILTLPQRVEHRLGLRGLTASVSSSGREDADLQFQELVRLRVHEGLYEFEDRPVIRPEENRFEVEIPWPPTAAPGRYRLRAFAVRGGRIVASAEQGIVAHKVGIESWLSHLAAAHGPVYGSVAALLAVALGTLAGLAFKPPRKPAGPTAQSP